MPVKQAVEEVQQLIASSWGKPWFRGAQRTSEVFISAFKDGSRNDIRAKRCAVMYKGFWYSHMDIDLKV